MDCGKVLYAVHDGTWVLRLNGDVRATWCSSLDALLDRLFADPALRGIVLAVLLTSVAAPLIGLDWTFGALIAVTAMLGDRLSSFIKRRMGLIPSSQCIGLDQIPESLLPLVACRFLLRLTILEIAAATVIFFLGELALSRVLFWLRIRERPY